MHSVPAGPVRQRSSVLLARAQLAYLGPRPGVRRTFARQLARALALAIQMNRDCSPRASTLAPAQVAAAAGNAIGAAKLAARTKQAKWRASIWHLIEADGLALRLMRNARRRLNRMQAASKLELREIIDVGVWREIVTGRNACVIVPGIAERF